MKKNRNAGIIGIGQTVFLSHREDVNQVELIFEAVDRALKDANLKMDDIECVVHGNMELFEMVHQPDCWHVLGTGAYGKEAFRLTTGGTTGGTLVAAADNLVSSGLYDLVLSVGFEKLEEGDTTGGITNMADPLWARALQTGALTGITAAEVIEEFGQDRAGRASFNYRVTMDQNARHNPNAHRRLGLKFEQTELIRKSPRLVGELRMIHMCSQSNGACALILASEERARALGKKTVWIRDHVTVHREETLEFSNKGLSTMRYAAEKLYRRNGITNPLAEIDLFEMYDPSSWWGLDWLRDFLLLKGDEHLKMIENGDIAITGRFPVNPSGGVTASNPIGATGMVRVAEAALQIRGDAGEHQVPKEVRQALASSFGGTMWTILFLLSKEITW